MRNPLHIAVLDALAGHTQPNGDRCVPFQTLIDDTGLDRSTVRRSCRYLTRIGLAEYHRGLWTEDGELGGAGYCISEKGQRKLEKPYDNL